MTKKSDPEIFKYEERYTEYGKYPAGKKTGFYRPNRLAVDYDGRDAATGEILPSMTKQSEMDACDINNILRQYSPQGLQQLIQENQAKGQYADLPDNIDFQEALNTVLEGEHAFATLPAKTRERFHNSPAEFLEFMANPKNQDEAINLGLATDNRPPPEKVQKVEIINTEPKTGGAGGSPPAGGAKAP